MIVTINEYNRLNQTMLNLHNELSLIRKDYQDSVAILDKVSERLSVVESNAVHKGAVGDLVIAVKALKEDYATFKANTLGGHPLSKREMDILLNGEAYNGKE